MSWGQNGSRHEEHLIRMVHQTLLAVRLLDLRARAVARHAEDLVVVLRLAALQVQLRLLQLRLQRADLRLRRRALRARLVNSGLEVLHRAVVVLQHEIDARACSKGFVRCGHEPERVVGVLEGFLVP